MPELPEVETIARELRRFLFGRKIISSAILGSHLCPDNRTALFQDNLSNRRICAVHRRGKLLLLDLDGQARLAFHLRMTGRLGLMPSDHAPNRHVHLLLHLDDESALFFQDQRKFGTCRYFGPGEMEEWPYFKRLGPEPLTLDAPAFAARLQGRKGRIKALLLDQEFMAGIGNIYADEALFRAGIHPATPAHRLPAPKILVLHRAIQAVLNEAIAAGGSSIRDYRTAAGLAGTFQDVFLAYGRKGSPCPSCGHFIQTTRVAGRNSSFCPRCQPLP